MKNFYRWRAVAAERRAREAEMKVEELHDSLMLRNQKIASPDTIEEQVVEEAVMDSQDKMVRCSEKEHIFFYQYDNVALQNSKV